MFLHHYKYYKFVTPPPPKRGWGVGRGGEGAFLLFLRSNISRRCAQLYVVVFSCACVCVRLCVVSVFVNLLRSDRLDSSINQETENKSNLHTMVTDRLSTLSSLYMKKETAG